MTQLKTSPELLNALAKAASRDLSAKTIHAQRVSFAMSAMDESGGVTRAKVEQQVAKQEGVRE